MIKTVAITRVLPPLSRQQGTVRAYRSNRYSKRLNNTDVIRFKQALSHAVGLSDYFELKERVADYYQQLKAVKEECARHAALRYQAERDKENFDALRERQEILLEIMTDWRVGVSGENHQTARAFIESEIIDYASILKSPHGVD